MNLGDSRQTRVNTGGGTGGGGPGAAGAVAGLKPRSRAEVPGQSTHFPRKSHTMPPICWGAADTEGSGSGGALPPGRGAGRGAEEGGLVLGGSGVRRWGHSGEGVSWAVGGGDGSQI